MFCLHELWAYSFRLTNGYWIICFKRNSLTFRLPLNLFNLNSSLYRYLICLLIYKLRRWILSFTHLLMLILNLVWLLFFFRGCVIMIDVDVYIIINEIVTNTIIVFIRLFFNCLSFSCWTFLNSLKIIRNTLIGGFLI